MPSILDCALLSLDVYSRTDNTLADSAGWNRLDGQNWQRGFAAGCYEKKGARIVAFRGTETDDFSDILSDVQMVPLINDQDAARTMDAMLTSYRVDGELSASMIRNGVSGLSATIRSAEQSALLPTALRVIKVPMQPPMWRSTVRTL